MMPLADGGLITTGEEVKVIDISGNICSGEKGLISANAAYAISAISSAEFFSSAE